MIKISMKFFPTFIILVFLSYGIIYLIHNFFYENIYLWAILFIIITLFWNLHLVMPEKYDYLELKFGK